MGAVPPPPCHTSPLGTYGAGSHVSGGGVSLVPWHGELGSPRAGDAVVNTKGPVGAG